MSEELKPVIQPGLEGIDLAQEKRNSGIDTYLAELNTNLIGLAPVKKRIGEISSLLLVGKVRERLGLEIEKPTLHMSFTGNPGTGKTTVAQTMADVLHQLEYIRTTRLVTVSRDDLVGEYIGHTAPKTKEVLQRAMGGVLFIDEAYYLYRPENERDYGQEAIEILLQVMESNRDDLVVILAGYGDRMERFFASNPGFRSRIAHHIDFPDYSNEELVDIAELMLGQQHYELSPAAVETLLEYVELRRNQPLFANARSVRNALDRAKLRQAERLVIQGTVSIDALSTIEPEDLITSRVFTQDGRLSESS